MQIHIYVSSTFWQELYEATDKWPEENRTQAEICRYALRELASETYQGESVPDMAPPTGTVHIQCRTVTPDDEEDWTFLKEKYGNGATTLRVALQYLYDSITATEDETTTDDSPWADFNKMDEEELLAQSTDVLRGYASHLGILSASKITGGKGVLVNRILATREVQSVG